MGRVCAPHRECKINLNVHNSAEVKENKPARSRTRGDKEKRKRKGERERGRERERKTEKRKDRGGEKMRAILTPLNLK